MSLLLDTNIHILSYLKVIKKVIYSSKQINRFSTTTFFKSGPSVLTTNNFRGVQPLNGRVVMSQRSTAPLSAATSTISIITVLLLSCLCWL